MKRFSSFSTVAALALFGWISPSFAGTSLCDAVAGNLVVNCGFETGDFTGWTVLNNDGFTSVQSTFDLGPNSGTFYAALGTIGGDATIEQTITDVPGQTYLFSFYHGSDGGQPNDFTAEWDGTPLLSLTDLPATPYTLYSFTETGTGSDTISFLARNDPSFDALDDVVVSGTPEPASLPLVAIALGGIALVYRRRLAR
jgi:hypothetical protein